VSPQLLDDRLWQFVLLEVQADGGQALRHEHERFADFRQEHVWCLREGSFSAGI
jgi:hypothetical protein